METHLVYSLLWMRKVEVDSGNNHAVSISCEHLAISHLLSTSLKITFYIDPRLITLGNDIQTEIVDDELGRQLGLDARHIGSLNIFDRIEEGRTHLDLFYEDPFCLNPSNPQNIFQVEDPQEVFGFFPENTFNLEELSCDGVQTTQPQIYEDSISLFEQPLEFQAPCPCPCSSSFGIIRQNDSADQYLPDLFDSIGADEVAESRLPVDTNSHPSYVSEASPPEASPPFSSNSSSETALQTPNLPQSPVSRSSTPLLATSPFDKQQSLNTTVEASHETANSSLSAPKIKLSKKDISQFIIELTLDEAVDNRNLRRAAQKIPTRSQQKQTNDRKRVDGKNNQIKARKERPHRCPDEDCPDPLRIVRDWSNFKKFQDHLAGHDIRIFQCSLCGKDFPRSDNISHHLRRGKKHAQVQLQLIAAKKAKMVRSSTSGA
ncbi:hypothetical protein H072_6782 [Dactylellina haptotyla CBS 200.50]|uniref:C2H2-type domain-containing protein n=1 Tax=Dactylellina haptotyla (strain CBS 200.50) TaxID=1284197 RepID=S8A9A8_DACHA|nr:hypothetical protein H072_6782 [Dactylellina haptotyla CBS 200.50]